MTVPDKHLQACTVCEGEECRIDEREGAGETDTDLILYVSYIRSV